MFQLPRRAGEAASRGFPCSPPLLGFQPKNPGEEELYNSFVLPPLCANKETDRVGVGGGGCMDWFQGQGHRGVLTQSSTLLSPQTALSSSFILPCIWIVL